MKLSILLPLSIICLAFLSCDNNSDPIEISLEDKLEDYEQISLTNMEVGQLSLYEVSFYSFSISSIYTIVLEVVNKEEDKFIIHEYIAYKDGVPYDEDISSNSFLTNEVMEYTFEASNSITTSGFEKVSSGPTRLIGSLAPNYFLIDSLHFAFDNCGGSFLTVNGEDPNIKGLFADFEAPGSLNDQMINGELYSNCYINYSKHVNEGRGGTKFIISNTEGNILRVYNNFTAIESYNYCASLVPIL